MQGKARPTRLIQAIADKHDEPEPYHNLVFAAECLRDLGSGRVEGNLENLIQTRLRLELETITLKKRVGPVLISFGPAISTSLWAICNTDFY